jgi:hypothetical protein
MHTDFFFCVRIYACIRNFKRRIKKSDISLRPSKTSEIYVAMSFRVIMHLHTECVKMLRENDFNTKLLINNERFPIYTNL